MEINIPQLRIEYSRLTDELKRQKVRADKLERELEKNVKELKDVLKKFKTEADHNKRVHETNRKKLVQITQNYNDLNTTVQRLLTNLRNR